MKNLIGIQFDSNEICLSQFDGKGLRMYSERMPENLVKNDQIVSQETFSSFLKDIKHRGHFTGRACALVLPLSTAYFRIISMPAMSDQQLRLNLPYEFKDYVGSDSFRYNFDYAVRNIEFDENGDPVTMELMAAAAQKETLDNYAAVLKKSGLRLKEAIPTEMALLNIARRAVKDGAKLDKEECICNIGMLQRIRFNALEALILHIIINHIYRLLPVIGVRIYHPHKAVGVFLYCIQTDFIRFRAKQCFFDIEFIHLCNQLLRVNGKLCPAAEFTDMCVCVYFFKFLYIHFLHLP